MLRFLASFFLIASFNIYGDILLSSPKIKLNAQDQRVIELKIQNETIKDGDVVLYEYKTDNPINKDDIAYTLIENFGGYQSYKIVLSENYLEDYFSFKILIKDNFMKDIFIFLPSKLRSFYEETPQQIIQKRAVIKTDGVTPIIEKNDEELLVTFSPKIFKGSEITTVWSMAEKIKSDNNDVSIYQIMWSIYLGNKEAFLNNNINLIRKDIDIAIPEISDIKNISYEFAKDSILKMNASFAQSFSSATKSLLVLTAPKVIKEIDKVKDIQPYEEEKVDIALNQPSNPKDFIEKNTREISLGVENETVEDLMNKVEELKEENSGGFELFDLLFISLISLACGGLLALIFIQLRNMKDTKSVEYDFDEAKDDESMISSMPKGLSIENNIDQQQFDLAVTYSEMNDQENAKKILSDLIKESNDDEIKTAARNILDKFN